MKSNFEPFCPQTFFRSKTNNLHLTCTVTTHFVLWGKMVKSAVQQWQCFSTSSLCRKKTIINDNESHTNWSDISDENNLKMKPYLETYLKRSWLLTCDSQKPFFCPRVPAFCPRCLSWWVIRHIDSASVHLPPPGLHPPPLSKRYILQQTLNNCSQTRTLLWDLFNL